MPRPTSQSPIRTANLLALLLIGSCVPPTRTEPEAERIVNITLPASGQRVSFDSIRAQISSKDLGELHSHERAGTCTAPCPAVTVQIQSVGRTKDIHPDIAVSKLRVIGKVTNTDPAQRDAQYQLEPKTTYLIWVEAATDSVTTKNQWGFFKLVANSSGPSEKRTIGAVRRCHTYFNLLKKSDTDFRDCSKAHTATALHEPHSILSRASTLATSFLDWLVPGPRPVLVGTGDGWFECGSGCCTGTSAN